MAVNTKIATEKFENLLNNQLERIAKMKENCQQKDFSKLETITIGICGGDGIGPRITKAGEDVLAFLLRDEVEKGRVKFKNIQGLTIENRKKVQKAIPDDVLEEIKTCDVLLKGPTTTPNGGTLGSANVALRRELDLFANIRPVKVPQLNIDWMFFRENTEGEYVLGGDGIEVDGGLTVDFKVTTDLGTERIARAAFEYAKNNGKSRVEIVTKANVIKTTDGRFSEIAHKVAEEYPDIACEEWYVDIITAKLIDEKRRSDFQVFLLPNLYGDIVTDEAAQIQGGVGTAGSGNIGSKYAMFEAIHGSAPRMVESGNDIYANPSSILKACEMLLNHIGYIEEAIKLGKAMEVALETEKKVSVTGRSDGATCQEFIEYLMEILSR